MFSPLLLHEGGDPPAGGRGGLHKIGIFI